VYSDMYMYTFITVTYVTIRPADAILGPDFQKILGKILSLA